MSYDTQVLLFAQGGNGSFPTVAHIFSPIFHFHLTIHNIILQNIQKEQLTQKLSGWLDLVCFCKFRQCEWSFQLNGLGNARSAEQGRINSNNKHICNHKNLSHKCTHNRSTFRAGINSSANLAQCTGTGQGNTAKHGETWKEKTQQTDLLCPGLSQPPARDMGCSCSTSSKDRKRHPASGLAFGEAAACKGFHIKSKTTPKTFLCNVFFFSS